MIYIEFYKISRIIFYCNALRICNSIVSSGIAMQIFLRVNRFLMSYETHGNLMSERCDNEDSRVREPRNSYIRKTRHRFIICRS